MYVVLCCCRCTDEVLSLAAPAVGGGSWWYSPLTHPIYVFVFLRRSLRGVPEQWAGRTRRQGGTIAVKIDSEPNLIISEIISEG